MNAGIQRHQPTSRAKWTLAIAALSALLCLLSAAWRMHTDRPAHHAGPTPVNVKRSDVAQGMPPHPDPTPQTEAFDWRKATEPTAQTRQALLAALADHPDKASEIHRLMAFARFQNRAALWRGLQQEGRQATQGLRLAVGAALLEDLPIHYARGELMGPQALAMAQTLIAAQAAGANEQAHMLARQQARLEQARATHDARADGREQAGQLAQEAQAAFLQQQADIVQKYRAQPLAQQDPRQLTEQLDALRQTLLQSAPQP